MAQKNRKRIRCALEALFQIKILVHLRHASFRPWTHTRPPCIQTFRLFPTCSSEVKCTMKFGIFLPPQALAGSKCPLLYYLSGKRLRRRSEVLRALLSSPLSCAPGQRSGARLVERNLRIPAYCLHHRYKCCSGGGELTLAKRDLPAPDASPT